MTVTPRIFLHPADQAPSARQGSATLIRYSRWFEFAWWAAALGFRFLHESHTWVALPVAALISIGAFAFRRATRRLANQLSALHGHTIVVDQPWVRQLNPHGAPVGIIHLEQPFQVTLGTVIHGHGIFEVTQSRPHHPPERLQFSSAIADGRTLVRDILKSDRWPRHHTT